MLTLPEALSSHHCKSTCRTPEEDKSPESKFLSGSLETNTCDPSKSIQRAVRKLCTRRENVENNKVAEDHQLSEMCDNQKFQNKTDKPNSTHLFTDFTVAAL